VVVQVNLDAAGSLFWGSRAVQRALREGKVQMRWFHRWSWREPLSYNRRNHRKLLVVDSEIGFLGGYNVHRENSRKVYGDTRWRDTHVRVRGVLARDLGVLFDAFWSNRRRILPYMGSPETGQLITNHSRRGRHFLRALYATKFAAASKSIHLTTPYFIPDRRTRQGLMRAAERGVEVSVLVPHRNNERIAQWAAHAFYASLLAAGVRIHEYLPRMLHAKTLVVDEEWCSVGTANLDYRSFFLNYELTLASTEPALVRHLERDFQADLRESMRIQPKRWVAREYWRRLLESIGWSVRRWL
jgi:cardiolipin synthase